MAKRPRPRVALVAEVLAAGRAQSTAAVMFHAAVAERQGLTASDEKALDLLERFGPLTAGELGRRSGLAPASVTGLVDRLVKRGFVRRVKDPADGRRVLVELDREAVGRLAPWFDDLVERLRELLTGYTAAELEVVLRFLREAAQRQQEATARLSKRS